MGIRSPRAAEAGAWTGKQTHQLYLKNNYCKDLIIFNHRLSYYGLRAVHNGPQFSIPIAIKLAEVNSIQTNKPILISDIQTNNPTLRSDNLPIISWYDCYYNIY